MLLALQGGDGLFSLTAVERDETEQVRWFADQIQPHLPILLAWLRKRYPVDCDFEDVVQEAGVRVLRAHERGEVRSPKAFLFVTARNLVLDRRRHDQVVRIESLAEIDELSVIDESAGIPASTFLRAKRDGR